MNFQTVNNSVTAVEFKLLFTSSERVASRELAKTDPVVADMFGLLDDPRTASVSLVMPQVAAMLDYLVSKNILTEDRKTAILSATLPDEQASAIPITVSGN